MKAYSLDNFLPEDYLYLQKSNGACTKLNKNLNKVKFSAPNDIYPLRPNVCNELQMESLVFYYFSIAVKDQPTPLNV